jgi:hypothetical protein
VTSYFLSESAIEEQGHRKIRSRGISLSSRRDNKFHLGEGLYPKNKITTAEKQTKLLIIDR